MWLLCCGFFCFFFFNDTATTEIYTLSLHDALPISVVKAPLRAANLPIGVFPASRGPRVLPRLAELFPAVRDRKSTRLNSSHGYISYAVFCLKKKKTKTSAAMTGVRCDQARDATTVTC